MPLKERVNHSGSIDVKYSKVNNGEKIKIKYHNESYLFALISKATDWEDKKKKSWNPYPIQIKGVGIE